MVKIIIHQSDLSALSRCAAEYGYKRAGMPTSTNSGAVFGTVMHHAVGVMEREIALGTPRPQALQIALENFVHYWHPMNVADLCEPVPADGWLRGQSYGGLREKGIAALRMYADLLRGDDTELLATEYGFQVPIDGTWDEDEGQPHILAGSVDRLGAGHWRRQLIVKVDDWKGLDLDTPLATPAGWTTMGKVAVGDQVFAGDGTVTTVVGKSEIHWRDCYRLTFDDGHSVVADADHLWQFETGAGRRRQTEILTTEQAARRGVMNPNRATPSRDLRIPNHPGLDLPDRDLPVDPWMLGYWLGNGKHTTGELTCHTKDADEIAAQCAAAGHAWGKRQLKDNGVTATALGLMTKLRKAGVLGVKHVPTAYLRAGRGQRLALLQGLMDSDGYANPGRREQHFTTTSPALSAAVCDLVASLGWNHYSYARQAHGFGRTVTAYEVKFRALDATPFRLQRKAANVPEQAHALSRQRIVQTIERIPTVPTQCIAVDHPSATYLCGEAMTVTHNTGKEYINLRQNLQGTAYCYASTKREFWEGWRGEDGFGYDRGAELFKRFDGAGRKFTWVNLRQLKFEDGGWRGPKDYQRLAVAVEQFAALVKADIYPLSISGAVCRYCDCRKVCAGTGLPDDEEGKPTRPS